MYLSDPIKTLVYQSGNKYVVSLEFAADRLRLFWEADDEDGEFESFTVFDATTELGQYLTEEEVIEESNQLIVAHQLEPEGSLERTEDHPTTTYPPKR